MAAIPSVCSHGHPLSSTTAYWENDSRYNGGGRWRCIECRRVRVRRLRSVPPAALPLFDDDGTRVCRNGHPRTQQNLVLHGNVWRCRECRRHHDRVARPGRTKPHARQRGYTEMWRTRSQCSRCGFIAEDPCQIDVDHIDSDHANNDPSNLQHLCANCHRLKTKRERLARRVS